MKPVYTILLAFCLFTACNNEKENNEKMIEEVADGEPVSPPAASPANVEISPSLDGTWELTYISGPKIAFEGLYPNKIPAITFDVSGKRVSGNTGCNNFSGELNTNGNSIDFTKAMAMTKMMCPGQGETVFLETLKKINTYSITDSTLNFIMGDIALMRFTKR